MPIEYKRGEYSLRWPLYFVWSSPKVLLLPRPRLLDPIIPLRTSSQPKGAQEKKGKNQRKFWLYIKEESRKTLWGNPDMLNTPCMSSSLLRIESGFKGKKGSQKWGSLLQLLKAGRFQQEKTVKHRNFFSRIWMQIFQQMISKIFVFLQKPKPFRGLLTLCTPHSNYLYWKFSIARPCCAKINESLQFAFKGRRSHFKYFML